MPFQVEKTVPPTLLRDLPMRVFCTIAIWLMMQLSFCNEVLSVLFASGWACFQEALAEILLSEHQPQVSVRRSLTLRRSTPDGHKNSNSLLIR